MKVKPRKLNVKMMKLDEDDICQIVVEHYQEVLKNSTYARSIVLGTPGDDLRLVAVYGERYDERVRDIDLTKIDKLLDYTGYHSKCMYITEEHVREWFSRKENTENTEGRFSRVD